MNLLPLLCSSFLAAAWLPVDRPDSVSADAPGAKVEVVARADGAADVRVSSSAPLSSVVLKWNVSLDSEARLFGGDWERTYGASGWAPLADSGPMPWYFLVESGGMCNGLGVKVQPNVFASWKVSADAIELILDCRAGSDSVQLGDRTLEACTIVARAGVKGETAFAAAQAFCRMMCDAPRRLDALVYGYNDWYCAYGRNTATNFLADAKAVLSFADGLANRPFAVVDDGWQAEDGWRAVNARWGMTMDRVAAAIRRFDAKPGLWYRPLRHFRDDPTRPAVAETVVGDIAAFRSWGFRLLKIDFITHDWNHSWNAVRTVSPVTADDLHWRDRSRTTAETVLGLYRKMREAAGDDMVIIGCNAIDHFAAGLFEVQRTGDDTSGCDWALTRRCGPNALGMRAHHHGTFYAQDGDCAGLSTAGAIDWARNSQWIDLLSRSGGAFFVSWRRDLLDDMVSDALRKAFARAASPQPAAEPLDWMSQTSPREWLVCGERTSYDWNATERKDAPETRFLVLGDLHFCNVDDHGDPTEARMDRLVADLKRKGVGYDFVVQVGDLVNCQTGYVARSMAECHEEWRHAIAEVKRLFPNKPFFTTPGNHDWYGGGSWQGGGPCIRAHYIPFMERELGAPLNGLPFFTFRHKDAFFIFLNHLGMEEGLDIECRKMLKKALAAADADPSIARVFAVSHPELWNVDYFRFNENATFLPLFMAARKFDAYFSGHVHMNNVTARKNDYGFALRQVCAAGVWPPIKEGADRYHPVPTLRLNPPPSKTIFADFPDDVESYTVVTATRDKVTLRFEAVGGGTIGEYEWEGPYDLKAVKPAAPRFRTNLPTSVSRAKFWYFPLFVDRILGGAPAPRVRVNGRDVGELRRNHSVFHTNWGGFSIDIPPELIGRENRIEIVNPSGERLLLRDCSIMAVDAEGNEHFTPVHPKVISFGDWRGFYMGFGLVHANAGILHSDIETNVPEELIARVPLSGGRAEFTLSFSDEQPKR